jgi:surface protein
MFALFRNCVNLRTIYVGEGWSTAAVAVDNSYGSDLFKNCPSLVGGQGTTYDANHVDKDYAHIDGGTSNPGYFTAGDVHYYDLWIAGTQASALNKNDILGDGKVSFDPGTNTLTLKGGTYQGTSSIQSALGCGIFSQIDGLTIDVQGETYATGADDNEGIRLSGESNTITGNAKLIARGYNGLGVDNSLTVSGNVELEAVGSHAGLIGRWRTRPEVVYYSTLIIKDNAKVRALGDTQASVGRLKEIILADGFSVTAPEGASVGEHSVVDANGNDVIGDAVRIERTKEAYAVYTDDNKTLTFYYDNQRSSRPGETYDLNTGENKPGWRTDVTKVVFDPSFANARPTTTYCWFLSFTKLESITGMSYLNTSEVTNMSWMFTYCDELTSLDVSNFNTSKVTNMAAMFCDCSSLTSLDVSNFNTENVYDMGNMFKECSSLTSLDLSSFNTSNVYRMYYMFQYCYNLRTIYVGEGWSTAVADRTFDMFDNCTSLVGGQGTTYDASHTDHTYAHIDGGPSNPGYFTDANSIVYDLWIAGTQASALNKNDILGDGKVSFDPETNTLTLNNANIHAATGYGIQSKLSYVKIVLIGENTITADNGMGVRFQPGAEEPDKAIIRGGGSLNIKASTVGLRSHLDLFLQFGAKITSEGGTVGFQGWKPASHAPLPTLTMTQLDTMLETKGARQGSLVDFGQLNLHRGMVIMQPSGATYAQDIGIVKDNSVVANEWVMICSQDYIDGISPTPAASRIGGETFNLAGQKVDGKYKGIVIKDGKKVLVK